MVSRMKWRQLNQFRRLPNAEKRILLAAMLVLTSTVIGLRLFGYKRCYTGLYWWARQDQWPRIADDELRSIRRTLFLMRLVVRHSLYPGKCLSQSLTLWWLLKRQGIESDLRIGVRNVDGEFQAHAWVEYHEQPVNDADDVQSQFAAFDKAIRIDTTKFVETEGGVH